MLNAHLLACFTVRMAHRTGVCLDHRRIVFEKFKHFQGFENEVEDIFLYKEEMHMENIQGTRAMRKTRYSEEFSVSFGVN